MPKKQVLKQTERSQGRVFAKVDKWQGNIARVLVILILCVQPLYVNWDGYGQLTGHKFWFFLIYMVCIIIAVICIWVYRMKSTPRVLIQERLSYFEWAILGFAVVTLISALFSPFRDQVNVWTGVPEPYGRYDGAITQILYVVAFFIVYRWYKPRVRDFVVFGTSAVLVGFIGIIQFFGLDPLGLWPQHIPEYWVPNFYHIPFRSTLGNVNIVSTYVCVAILLCGFLYIRYDPTSIPKGSGKSDIKWRQPLWLAGSALCFWLMDLAGSDSGLVGVVVATFLAIPFIIESRKTLGRFLILVSTWVTVFALQRLFYQAMVLGTRSPGSLLPYFAVAAFMLAAGVLLTKWGKEPDLEAPVQWKLGVIMIVACVAVGLIGVEVLGRQVSADGFAGRVIIEARDILHGNLRDEMGTNRVYIWRNALSVVPNHPIIGSGPDTFLHAFPPDAHMFYGEPYDKAHNEYIQILVCQGIIGLLCYLVFIGGVFAKGITKPFRNPLVMAVLAAFVGYCVQAFFNISVPIASQMLWVAAGMLASKRFRETPLAELA